MLKKKNKTRTKILQFLPVHINWRPCSEFGQSQQAGRHLSRCCGLHLKVQASNGFFKTLPLRGIRARSLWVWTWWYFAVNSFKFLIWWGVGLDECQPASLEEKGGWKSPPTHGCPRCRKALAGGCSRAVKPQAAEQGSCGGAGPRGPLPRCHRAGESPLWQGLRAVSRQNALAGVQHGFA